MLVSLVFGVLIDLDHFVDYYYAERRPVFNLRDFLATRYWRKSGRVLVLFHAFEYLPLLFFVWQAWKGRRWAVAATSAMASHLVADHFANELKPLGYFISYRIKHGFRASELMDFDHDGRLQASRRRRAELARAGRLPLRDRLLSLFV